MKERPVLFNGEMVRAILDGRKTQTRRLIKPQPIHIDTLGEGSEVWIWHPDRVWATSSLSIWLENCPYGVHADLLYVRETFMLEHGGGPSPKVIYRATTPEYGEYFKWRPSIHMPRWASRILLEVTDVQVQRVQEISELDAQREGWDMSNLPEGHCYDCTRHARDWFHALWDSIYAKQGYGWNMNPWAWVVEFKVKGDQ